MNKNIIRILIFILLLAGIALAVIYREQINVERLESWVNDAGIAGPIVFMLVYIIGTVVFFPGSVLTLAGGALFGPVLGTFYNLTAATVGAVISFAAARYLAHDWVEQKAGGKLKSLKQGVESEGWRFVAFTRLVPLFPFNLLNYALGLTKIKLNHYSVATYICMLPGAIAYTYLGYVGREALAGDETVIQKVMVGIALLAVVSFLPSLITRLRAKPMIKVEQVKEKLDAGEDILLLDVRSEKEFSGELGHIKGALLIPLQELKQSIEKIQSFQEKTVLTICKTDRRSAKAAQILARNGFADVHVVKQGMTAWNEKLFPIVRGI